MLFKFKMDEVFTEWEDRIGCISAPSIQEAVKLLMGWNDETYDAGAYTIIQTTTTYNKGHAIISFKCKDDDGFWGWDRYHIEAVEAPIFTMTIDGWDRYFSRFPEQHDIHKRKGEMTLSYCPEDGTKMPCANDGISDACYDCPTCDTHWFWDGDEGSYQVIVEPADCPGCGEDRQQPEKLDMSDPETRAEARRLFRLAITECAIPKAERRAPDA